MEQSLASSKHPMLAIMIIFMSSTREEKCAATFGHLYLSRGLLYVIDLGEEKVRHLSHNTFKNNIRFV